MHRVRSIKGQDEAAGLELVVETVEVTRLSHVDAVKQQTSKELDKKAITVPDINEVGTYDVSVKLHPEVTGAFKLEVQKA